MAIDPHSTEGGEADPAPGRDRLATVNERGDLVLPAPLLRQFGLVPGEQVHLDVAEHSIRVRRPLGHLARIYLEPTGRCNMDCAMCQRRTWPGETGDMAPEVLVRVLDALAACQPPPTVVLGGFGEPLLHGGLMEFIRQARDRGARVELITNGLLLDGGRLQRLRDLGLERLWLSVDGGQEGCCGHAMDRGAFADLVRLLWAANTPHHFPHGRRLKLGIVFVAMKSNLHALPSVLDLARQLHADRVLVSNLLAYAPDTAGEILYGRSVGNADSDHFRVRLPRVDLGEGVLELLGQAMRHHDLTDVRTGEFGQPFNTCPFVEAGSVAIRWDGGVSPCLPLLHTHVSYLSHGPRRTREHLFGSLGDRGLLEIWRDPRYVEFRRRVMDFDFPPCLSCGTCDWARHNEEDCYGNPFPTCGGCLWAQGLVLCP
ncbi:MAG: radical SAM protein [Gemmatimonadota bacterium]